MSEIDQYQRAAACSDAQRLLVLAGAGAGKTRTLVARVHRLLRDGVPPQGILLVTFSREAAKELRRRLPRGVTATTLHGLGYWILQDVERWKPLAEDQLPLVRRLMKQLQLWGPAHSVVRAIGQVRRECFEASEGGLTKDQAEVLTQAYLREKMAAQRWDWDDMILLPQQYMLAREGLRQAWRGRWSHIMVDETQDTDTFQWQLLGALALPTTGITLVADVSQSIYGFRGAVPYHLIDGGIDEQFGGPFEQLQLPTNYRSEPAIVKLANGWMCGARGALTLQPARGVGTENAVRCEMWGAGGVVGEIQRLRQHYALSDIAVLYRLNAMSAEYEGALLSAGIPYQLRGPSFFSRADVRDLMAYCRLGDGWDLEAACRVMNRPTRYLGMRAQEIIRLQWPAVLEDASALPPQAYHAWRKFVLFVHELQRRRARGGSLASLVDEVLVEYASWAIRETPDDVDDETLARLRRFREVTRQFDTVSELEEFASQCMRGHGSRDAVQLMTIHRSKGLEWPVVFVGPCDPGRESDEERRIGYVAVTRARDRLYVVAPGEPSNLWSFVWENVEGCNGDGVGSPVSHGDAGGDEAGVEGRDVPDDAVLSSA